MKTVAENHAMTFAGAEHARDGAMHDIAMGKIAEDLRAFYGKVADSEQPDALLDLARALDARLSPDDDL